MLERCSTDLRVTPPCYLSLGLFHRLYLNQTSSRKWKTKSDLSLWFHSNPLFLPSVCLRPYPARPSIDAIDFLVTPCSPLPSSWTPLSQRSGSILLPYFNVCGCLLISKVRSGARLPVHHQPVTYYFFTSLTISFTAC